MSPFERRVQRLAVIIPVLAIIAAVLGMIPGGVVSLTGDEMGMGEPIVYHPIMAGGWTLVAFAVMHALIARHVYRHPTRVWRWFAAALVSVPLGLIVWATVEHSYRSQSIEWRPAGEAMGAFIGAVFMLLLIVLPSIALYSDRSVAAPTTTARVVR